MPKDYIPNITVTAHISPWLLDPQIGVTNQMKRNAGNKAAKAALKYLQDHAPVDTGRMASAWKFSTARGYTYSKDKITLHLENNAYQIRPREGMHFYARYPEYGFFHILQRQYHYGRKDTYKAAVVARDVIIESILSDMDKAVEKAEKQPKLKVSSK